LRQRRLRPQLKRDPLGRSRQLAQGKLPISAPTSSDRNTRALAYLRIRVGVLFLIFGEYKVFGTGFTLGGGFQSWINRFLADGAYPFMVPVLRGFVLPHGTAIAFLVAYGELAIGIALVLGLLVRSASICGAIYMLALLFSSDYPGPRAAFWQYFGASLSHSVFALCFGVFVVGRSDAVLSLRPLLRRWVGASGLTSA
jgi:thiosulfate dehydrogenase (quinone) large subunit